MPSGAEWRADVPHSRSPYTQAGRRKSPVGGCLARTQCKDELFQPRTSDACRSAPCALPGLHTRFGSRGWAAPGTHPSRARLSTMTGMRSGCLQPADMCSKCSAFHGSGGRNARPSGQPSVGLRSARRVPQAARTYGVSLGSPSLEGGLLAVGQRHFSGRSALDARVAGHDAFFFLAVKRS
jgi:hypothetical protein